jgi:iron complex transport system ATP-binding protein
MNGMLTSPVAACSVADVRFSYQAPQEGGGTPWTLDGISFDLEVGKTLGVIGPNGSGKTSLLKLLAKVLRPRSGEIRLFGLALSSLSQTAVARRVAYVPQENASLFPFSIVEMVLMGRFPHRAQPGLGLALGWDTRVDQRVAEEAMATMDIRHLQDRLITEVSGGERQRVFIARALAQEPQILLLDEPTAFLDLNHQLEICTVLRRLSQERELTVVLVSHDLNLASLYCDRLLLLDRGRIFRAGTPREVIRPEILKTVYGCEVLVDRHPETGSPRVTLPGPQKT